MIASYKGKRKLSHNFDYALEDEDPEDAERLRQFIAKQLTMSNDLDTNEQEERISNDIFRLKGKSMPKFGKSSESQAIAKDLQIDASTFEALLREQQERANISDREEYLRRSFHLVSFLSSLVVSFLMNCLGKY